MDGYERSPRLLVVEDDETVLDVVVRRLERMGYETHKTRAGHEAIELAKTLAFDVCILDVHLPDGVSGLDLISELRKRDETVGCIVMTGDVSAEMATAAYTSGAEEYVEKPIEDWDHFETLVARAIQRRRKDRQEPPAPPPSDGIRVALRQRIAGTSKAMDAVRRALATVAGNDDVLLVSGPEGVGKTHVADMLHQMEGRSGPFEVVDASHIGVLDALFGAPGRRGAIERARNGTVVLAGLESVPESAVARIKGALAGRRSGTRFVLEATSAEGAVGELASVAGAVIPVPSLAERPEDVPHLVYTFLKDVNQREGLGINRVPPEILVNLRNRAWPTNLRGLRGVVEQVALFSPGDTLDIEALPAAEGVRPSVADGVPSALPDAYRELAYTDFKERVLSDFVRLYVHDLLDRTDGNITRAAELAEMHRPNFRRLMVRFGVDAPK
jgi:two-component system nitrogen regulation response regulator NtrX